jgi:hypothetical protein
MNSAGVPQIAALVVALSAAALSAQTIRIRLVNGRNGKPMAGAHINLFLKGRKLALVVPKGKDGVAPLVFTDEESKVNVPPVENYGSSVVTNPVVKYDDHLWINIRYCVMQGRRP